MIAPQNYALFDQFSKRIFNRVEQLCNERRADLAVFDERYAKLNLSCIVVSEFLVREPSLSIYHPKTGLKRVTPGIAYYLTGKTRSGHPFVEPMYFSIISGQIDTRRYQRRIWLQKKFGAFGAAFSGLSFDQRSLTYIPAYDFSILNGSFLTFQDETVPENIDTISGVFSFLKYGRFPKQSQGADDAIIVEEIVKLFDAGERVTREECRQLFAADIKHEAWRALWSQAVAKRPDLSKPGRRKS